MVFASDAGYLAPHGLNAGELAEYVRRGSRLRQAIATATIERCPTSSGSAPIPERLERRKRADLIAVEDNPLTKHEAGSWNVAGDSSGGGDLDPDAGASHSSATRRAHPPGLTLLLPHGDVGSASRSTGSLHSRAYMTEQLLTPGHVEHVIGYADLPALGFPEACSGRCRSRAMSSQIYGLYTGLLYFTPFFGGMLADRWLGQFRTVILGAVLMAIGHFLMALESTFFVALTVLILATAVLSQTSQLTVGNLYAPATSAATVHSPSSIWA